MDADREFGKQEGVMSVNALGVVNSNVSVQSSSENLGKATPPKVPTSHPATTTEDTTSFTSGNHTVQSLSQTALQTIPSRQSKVEALKLAVNSAQYQLDSDKISQSLANADV